jgi:hypothetical protein
MYAAPVCIHCTDICCLWISNVIVLQYRGTAAWVPNFQQTAKLPAPACLAVRKASSGSPSPISSGVRTLPLRERLNQFGCGGALYLAIDGDTMLKITVVTNGKEQRLMVEGKLAEPCVSELESAWNQVRLTSGHRPIVVDLSGVTLINSTGEAALQAIVAEGARLIAKGLYSEFVVRQLMQKAGKACTRDHNAGTEKHSRFTSKHRLRLCSANEETK